MAKRIYERDSLKRPKSPSCEAKFRNQESDVGETSCRENRKKAQDNSQLGEESGFELPLEEKRQRLIRSQDLTKLHGTWEL